jgi:hypothetical protein
MVFFSGASSDRSSLGFSAASTCCCAARVSRSSRLSSDCSLFASSAAVTWASRCSCAAPAAFSFSPSPAKNRPAALLSRIGSSASCTAAWLARTTSSTCRRSVATTPSCSVGLSARSSGLIAAHQGRLQLAARAGVLLEQPASSPPSLSSPSSRCMSRPSLGSRNPRSCPSTSRVCASTWACSLACTSASRALPDVLEPGRVRARLGALQRSQPDLPGLGGDLHRAGSRRSG